MSHLKQFAAFVKKEKLDEFVAADLKMVQSFNIPLLSLFAHLTKEQLFDLTKDGVIRFLNSLIDGNEIEVVTQRLHDLEEDKLPGIPRNAVSITDILLIYAAQKISLITFIPAFTTESSAAIDLVFKLEMYYKEVSEISQAILQKIQYEEQLKLVESEEKYKDLFDNANDLIHILDPAGQILYANNAWLKTLNYSADELNGRQISSVIAEEYLEIFIAYRKKVLAGFDDHDGISTCYVGKDGKRVFVEGHITCKFKDGIPQYTRAILRDISKRKEDEQKLKFYNEQLIEREENITLLIQNAPDAVIVIDEHSKIILWNPKAETIFGWTVDEVINKDLAELIIPNEYRAAHNSGMKRYLATGEIRVLNTTIEITALNKAGETFFVSLTISKSRQAGQVVFIAFIRDITQQKKNQLELESKRKQLEKTNEELEQYAWLASHDLKEPLRKIMTFSDILLTQHLTDLPPAVQKHLHKISDSTKRMNSLIEAIMVYSNVPDNINLFEKTDLNLLVKEVINDLEVLVKTKNGTVNFIGLPDIDAIKIQMRQLFQNLISNALKYSKGDIEPVIDITSKIENGNCIISIKDNGIGFHNQYAEKIFQVFQRLSNEKKYEGTGIGLALCKKIAETHNGVIEARSQEGIGSIFTVILPLKHIPVEAN
jgi:PAS domain S-box-containing protein